MTTTVDPVTRPAAGPPDLSHGALSLRRRITNKIALGSFVVAVLVAVVPLGLVVWSVINRGGGVISWEFLTDEIPNSFRRSGGGVGPAAIGTLIITGMAALMAIPLGVLGAIYLNEYGKQRPLARLIRMMSDIMTGVPSIVMGLFIYSTWVLLFDARTPVSPAPSRSPASCFR